LAVVAVASAALAVCGTGAIADGVVAIGFFAGIGVDFLGQSIVCVVFKGGAVAVEVGVAGLVAIGVVDEVFALAFGQGACDYAP